MVSAHFPASTLFELILAISQTRSLITDGSTAAEVSHRQAIKDAVTNLLRD